MLPLDEIHLGKALRLITSQTRIVTLKEVGRFTGNDELFESEVVYAGLSFYRAASGRCA